MRNSMFSVLRQLVVRYFLLPTCYIFVILIMCRKVTRLSSMTFIDNNTFLCMSSSYEYNTRKQSISDRTNFFKIEKMTNMIL